MKRVVYLLLILVACAQQPSEQLNHINGYWEIEEVIMPDGQNKVYKFSNTVDYIEINENLKGFRKKLKPQLNSTYNTSQDAEAIKAIIQGDSLVLHYSTAFDTWKETVLHVDEKTLKVQNENNILYLYKRYEPINLNLDDL